MVAQTVVPAKGHTEVIDTAVQATCTATGLTQGKHCSVCNAVIVAQTVVPAKGHTEIIDAAVPATCTATGLTQGKHCSACNAVIVAQTVVPAKGHTEVIDAAVAATCTATGLTQGKHCSVCNAVLVAQTVVPAKGHTEVIDAAVPATCTTTGLTQGKHCSVCNAVLVAQTVVPAKGHTEVIDEAVPATCTATGLTQGKHCSVCNAVLVAQTVISAKGHTEVSDAAVAPTATTTGLTEGKHCSVCNEVLVAQTVVPALGYNVTFKDWNGTVLKSQNVQAGASATAPSNPTRSGYRFTSWDKTFTNINADTVVTAQYIQQFTVTFKDWDGTTLKSQTVDFGSAATAPSNPTRDGYTFNGWSGSYANITANMTVTATYTEISGPTIIFDKVTANAGETISVKLKLYNNPGIAASTFKIMYDSSVLTLNSVDFNNQFGGDFDSLGSLNAPVSISWSSMSDINNNEVFLTLNFKVKDDAQVDSTSNISVIYNAGDFCNLNEDDVFFAVVSGSVTVK